MVHAADLEKLGNHGGARTYTEFGENPAKVRANCPATDVQNTGDDFVGMTLRDHAHNFLLARTERNASAASGFRKADQQVAKPIEFRIDENFLATLAAIFRLLGAFCL